MSRRLRTALIFSAGATAIALALAGTLFALLHNVTLRRFNDPDSGDLVVLHAAKISDPEHLLPPSPSDLADLRDRSRTIDDIAAWYEQTGVLTTDSRQTPVTIAVATPNLLNLLNTTPALGSGFRSTVADSAAASSVIVSEAFWRNQLGGRAEVVGTTISLNNTSYRVAGVLPGWFFTPNAAIDAWIGSPFIGHGGNRSARAYVFAMARLRPSTTVYDARQDLQAIAHSLASEYPTTNRGWTVNVQPYERYLLGQRGNVLRILSWLALATMILATVTLSNLLVARVTERASTIKLQAILGGTPRTVLPGALSTPIGIGVALVVTAVPVTLVLTQLLASHASEHGLLLTADPGRAALTTLLACVVTPVPAGAAALLLVLELTHRTGLGHQPRHSSVRFRLWGGRVALVAQAAATVVLVAVALLALTSYRALQRADMGFETHGLLTARVNLLSSISDSPDMRRAKFQELLDSALAVPGVMGAAAATVVPFGSSLLDFSIDITPVGLESDRQQVAGYRVIHGKYFDVVGIKMLAGESPSDGGPASEPAIVVNRALANRLGGIDAALDRRITLHYVAPQQVRVAGVVEDLRSLDGDTEPPALFVPLSRAAYIFPEMSLVVRYSETSFDTNVFRRRLDRLTPEFPLYEVATIAGLRGQSLTQHAILLYASAGLAAMSGLIALFGVLGLARLELARDLPSLAIRAALGAGPRQLVGFRVRQILPFSVVGASFGSGCVLLLGDTVLQPGFGEGLFTISVAVGGGITALFLATILGLAVPMRALARTNLSSVLRNPQG